MDMSTKSLKEAEPRFDPIIRPGRVNFRNHDGGTFAGRKKDGARLSGS